MATRAAKPDLIGRDEPRSRIAAALDAALAGTGCVVWLSGDAGIGKTALLAEAAGRARAAGAMVVTASGWDDPGTPPLWLWTQVVRAAAGGRRTGDLLDAWGPRARPAIALVDPAAADRGPGLDGSAVLRRFALHDALGTMVDDLLRTSAVVLVLDDVHWADPESLRALAFLAHLAGHRRLAVLVGWRDHEHDPDSEASRLADDVAAAALRIPVTGLDEQGVARMLAVATGADVDPIEVRRIAERTGGNPLFVGELGRLLRERGGQVVASAVPDTAHAVIRRRLGRLSQPAHDVLGVVAVAGPAATFAVVAEVAGLDAGAVADAVDESVRAGLAVSTRTRITVAHPLIRDVAGRSVPASRSRELHLAVAEVLRRRLRAEPALAAEVAHHLVTALPLSSADDTADILGRAAASALHAGAHEEAVAHARTGLDIAERPERRFRLLLTYGEALLATGDVDGSRGAFTAAAAIARDAGDAGGFAAAALGYAAGLSGFEVRLLDRSQLDLLDEAVARLPGEDSAERADLLGRLSVATAFTDRAADQRPLAEQALAIARRLGDPRAVARALAAHCDAIAGPDDAEARVAEASEVVDIAERVGDRALLLLGLRLRVVAHLELGEATEARSDMRDFGRVAEDLGQPLYAWYVPLWRGYDAVVAGDVAAVGEAADEAETIGARADSRNAAALAFVLRLWAAALQGRLGEALPAVDLAALPEIAPDGNDLVVHLQPDRPAEVRSRALTSLAGTVARIARDSEYLSNLCHFATALFEADDAPEHALVLLDALRPHAHRFAIDGIAAGTHGSVHRLVGAMQLLAGQADAAVESLDRALLANAGAPVPTMWTERMAAVAYARRAAPGDAERADALVRRARATADRLGIRLGPHPELDRILAVGAAAVARPTAPGGGSDPARSTATWRREGDGWRVAFRGRTVVLRDTKGTADLHELLGHIGSELHALDLMTRSRSAAPVRSRTGPEGRPGFDEVSGGGPGDLGEVLDEQARRSYRARLSALEAEVADAEELGDAAAAERARSEREAIVAGLAAAYGLGGRARRTGDLAERARTAVTWRIRDAIRRVEAVHPDLGRHLRASVRTGTFCSYAPEEDPHWEL